MLRHHPGLVGVQNSTRFWELPSSLWTESIRSSDGGANVYMPVRRPWDPASPETAVRKPLRRMGSTVRIVMGAGSLYLQAEGVRWALRGAAQSAGGVCGGRVCSVSGSGLRERAAAGGERAGCR